MAGITLASRAYRGRNPAGEAQPVLGDAAGRARLELGVAPGGAARIAFRDAANRVPHTIDAAR